MNAHHRKIFRPSILAAVVIWTIFILLIVAINTIGVIFDHPDISVASTMLLLAGWGHIQAFFYAYCLHVEVKRCQRDFPRLLLLKAGSELPEKVGPFSSSLLKNLQFLKALGIDAENANREALAALEGEKWRHHNCKTQAIAKALVSLGVVFTMLGFTLVGHKLSIAFAVENADLLGAVIALLPAMATATVSSLMGGFFGGVSLAFITHRMDGEIDSYETSIRAILEFTDLS